METNTTLSKVVNKLQYCITHMLYFRNVDVRLLVKYPNKDCEYEELLKMVTGENLLKIMNYL